MWDFLQRFLWEGGGCVFLRDGHIHLYGKIGNEFKDIAVSHGYSDISVLMNVYMYIGFDDAEEELKRMKEFRKAQAEIEKKNGKLMSWNMFKVI